MSRPLERWELWGLLAILGALVLVVVPDLGSPPSPFAPDRVEPRAPLGRLVRAAGSEGALGVPGGAALFAGLLVAGVAAAAWQAARLPRWLATLLTASVIVLLLVPATLLSVGLRDATEPWLFTNDSTYQIEIAGQKIL